MNALTNLNYNGHEVRTINKEDGMWWVLKDICTILELDNSRMVFNRLDDDEKGVSQIDTLGGKQQMQVISESGLYAVILRSDKPEAKPFRKWVTSEVLPSIRKTGKYEIASTSNQKSRIRILNLNGMKVVSNADLAKAAGVSSSTIRYHAANIQEYGIKVDGEEMARLKRLNPDVAFTVNSMVVYSVEIAQRILGRMGITDNLLPDHLASKPSSRLAAPPNCVANTSKSLGDTLTAFNELAKIHQSCRNRATRRALSSSMYELYQSITRL